MPGSDHIELQRSLRARLQRAKSDLADPHAVAVALVPDLREVGEGLQSFRGTMPIIAEIGDTLSEIATLIQDLIDQLAEVKADATNRGSPGE